MSEEDVEDFLKKVNYPWVVLYDDLDDAPKKIGMLKSDFNFSWSQGCDFKGADIGICG